MKLTKQQEEYFKNSKIRDEEGSLKVVYHGSPNGNFNEFRGITFFTDTKELADYFTKPRHHYCNTNNPHIFECYINCENPLIFNAQGNQYNNLNAPDYIINQLIEENKESLCAELNINSWDDIDNFSYSELDEKDLNLLYDMCSEEYYENNGITIEQLQFFAEENGYDGIIVNNVTDLNDNKPRTQYVVFEPNQIKSIDNLYPTKSNNIYEKNIITKDMSIDERLSLTSKIKDNINKEDNSKHIDVER